MKHILITVNSSISKLYKTREAVIKIAVIIVGSAGLVKSAVGRDKDLLCKDYLCFTVNCIGVCANILTVCTSLLPGSNITLVVTIPISMSCKSFR